MMQKYLAERDEIPDGNLIEIRYEDFITQPFQGIKNVYETLHLKGFLDVQSAFRVYIDSQKSITTDQYILNEEIQQKIERKWSFAIKEFGYYTQPK